MAGQRTSMAITYYKRFRMEISVVGHRPAPLPAPFFWKPWEEPLLDEHADVKRQSFEGQIDAHVFPCLGSAQGCRRLMREIRRKAGFLPGATWLIASPSGYVATIQGVVDREGMGSIQNVGVIPAYRGRGLGRALVGRALMGFQEAGVSKVYLEVTAENITAVRLYRSLGFHRIKTLYKVVDQ